MDKSVGQQGRAPEGMPAGEVAFLQVMNAYRRAKASGDAERIAQAERALQDHVRAEMSCGE